MRDKAPEFQCVFEGRWGIAWRGRLRAVSVTYDVLILLWPGGQVVPGTRLAISASKIHVMVLNPALERRSAAPDDPIPHLYRRPEAGAPPVLCMFDPNNDEWRMIDPIPDTILPWTVGWLAAYEMWHLTGRWSAREAEHPLLPDRPAPSPRVAGGKAAGTRGRPAWCPPERPLMATIARAAPDLLPVVAWHSLDVEEVLPPWVLGKV